MFPPLARFLLPAILLFVLIGCNGSSPTAPHNAAQLIGTWEGELAVSPAGEDWSRVTLSLELGGDALTGTLTSRNGVTHPVAGTSFESRVFSLEIRELPHANAPCEVTLVVDEVSSTALEGRLSGRCANTLMSRFRLERAR